VQGPGGAAETEGRGEEKETGEYVHCVILTLVTACGGCCSFIQCMAHTQCYVQSKFYTRLCLGVH